MLRGRRFSTVGLNFHHKSDRKWGENSCRRLVCIIVIFTRSSRKGVAQTHRALDFGIGSLIIFVHRL